MKLFKDLLNENAQYFTKVDLTDDEIVELIKTKCKTMLEAYRSVDKFLMRGFLEMKKQSDQGYATGLIRPDRKPLYLDPKMHNMVSDVMEENGFPSRRNALFCAATRTTAETWGGVCVLFLEDGWQGTYFTKLTTRYSWNDFDDLFQSLKFEEADEQKQKDMIEDTLNRLGITKFNTSPGLAKVVDEGHGDILINGSRYHAIPYNRAKVILADLGINY